MKKLLISGIIWSLFWFNIVTAQDMDTVTEEELLFTEIPVVFAAAKFEQKIEEAPACISIITQEEIKRSGYSNISQALRHIAGLYISYNRSYEQLGVRGYGIPGDIGAHVLILINGLSLNDPVYGSGLTGNELCIDIDSIKRIEVVKGPGSALYGSHAVFCVINIVTKDGIDVSSVSSGYGLEVTGDYGSYQTKKGGLSYGNISDRLDTFIGIHWMDSQGQDLYFPEYTTVTNNGVFEHGDKEKYYNFFTKLSYENLNFQAGINERKKHIPTGFYNTVFNDPRTWTKDRTNFVELKYTPNLDKNKNFFGRIYHCQYAFDGNYIQNTQSTTYKNVDWMRSNWLGLEVQFNYKTSANNRLTIGGEYQNQYKIYQKNYDEGIKEWLNDKRKLWLWSFYLQDIYKVIENLSFTFGGRIDHYSNFGNTINPRIGVVFNQNQYSTLKFLYGSAFLAPSSEQLYYNDGGWSMIANPDLKPEKLKTYEFVCEQKIGKNTIGVLSLYRTDLSNIISKVEIKSNVSQYRNTGKIEANGVELGINGIWNKTIFSLSSNFQKAKDKNTNKRLVNSPDKSANLKISHPFFNEKIYLTTEFEHLGKRLTVKREEEWLDPYLCTDLTLFSNHLVPNMEFTFKINNLFDESYAHVCSVSYKQTKIPQNRRNYRLKIGYKF